MSAEKRSAYRDAGVDIDAQDAALNRVKELARATFTSGVESEIGSFGGLFRPDLDGVSEPVLVASADGVGTKMLVAAQAGDLTSVGRDLVNHCVNDILVQGAKPLFFLDYIAGGRLDPEQVVDLVSGVAAACREAGCALLGGETAEMPGVYRDGDYDLVGFVVGLVERGAVLDARRVRAGDLLLGLPSSGLHTNGYTLARSLVLDRLGLALDDIWEEVDPDRTVGQILLEPHRSYLADLRPLLGSEALHAVAHVTGGGLTDNLPRILPEGCRAVIDRTRWQVPRLFSALQDSGQVTTEEMFRVFNMGIGMVLVIEDAAAEAVLTDLRRGGLEGHRIGRVAEGRRGVAYEPALTGAGG